MCKWRLKQRYSDNRGASNGLNAPLTEYHACPRVGLTFDLLCTFKLIDVFESNGFDGRAVECHPPLCLGKVSDPGQSGGDARVFLEAVLSIARTGPPWRDLPADFGHWNSVFKQCRRWVKCAALAGAFSAL
jgi:hypothetical protein